jgi:hypothetical protein
MASVQIICAEGIFEKKKKKTESLVIHVKKFLVSGLHPSGRTSVSSVFNLQEETRMLVTSTNTTVCWCGVDGTDFCGKTLD